MSDFKTTDYITGVVCGLLTSIKKPKYLKTAPDFVALRADRPAEYIVINCLPIPADVMQKCFVNVNYHVKDIGPGQPDVTKIEAGSTAVIAILKKVTGTNYLIDIESQETIREAQLNEHFSNLRFSFKQINS